MTVFSDKSAVQNDNSGFKKKFLHLLPAMLLFIYMFFMFGTYETYFANIQEWRFDFWVLLVPSLVVLAAGLVLTVIFAKIFNSRFVDIFIVILTSICLMAYVQANFLNTHTFLDGSRFETTIEEFFVNLLLWTAVLIIPVLCYEKWKNNALKVVVFTSILLLFMQIAPLPVMFINGFSSVKNLEYDSYCLSGEKQFEVSSSENVIVFIMDTYSCNDFYGYIDANPDVRTGFLSDFTFFDNVTTEVVQTSVSMPHLLTNHDVDYSISLVDSNAAAWMSDEAADFYEKMHENGYKVRLYTDNDKYSGDAKNMVGKIDNVIKYHAEYKANVLPTYFSMLQLSFFRYSPVFMKNPLYVPDSAYVNQHVGSSNPIDNLDLSEWEDSSYSSKNFGTCYMNADYYQSLTEGLTSVSDEKICVFQHIHGMHEPFVGIYDNELVGRSSTDAVNGCMSIFKEYTDQLKSIGVYDNSTIILTADHGSHEFLNQSQPVMLIKPAGTTNNSMTINTAPGVLQDDLLPTILDCIGAKSTSSTGYSLFSLDENMHRTRAVRMIHYSPDLKSVNKCVGVGKSIYNCYMEYTFDGRITDLDFDSEKSVVYPITDFWW